MDTIQPVQPSLDPDSDNPLLFWVAYIPGEGEKRNYLSDGKGHLRMFKKKKALRDYLKPQLSPEVYEMVVMHQVQGKIALPDDGTLGAPLPTQRRIPKIMPIIPLDIKNIQTIRTFAPHTVPTAQEQLDSLVKRKRRRRH